jgi:hypothetical protein
MLMALFDVSKLNSRFALETPTHGLHHPAAQVENKTKIFLSVPYLPNVEGP